MNKLFLSLLLFGGSFLSFAQTGSIEVNTGGFSFIPAFTSREPNIILNAGTNPQKRLSGHLMYMMRMKSLTPTTIVLITRYKLSTAKLKATLGLHIPALQVRENYEVTSLFGQELTLTYPLTKKFTLGTFLLNGQGRNADFKAFFGAVNGNYHTNNWNFLSQAYYVDKGNLNGVAQTISYDINAHFQIKAFANYTITDQFFISTLGVNYRL